MDSIRQLQLLPRMASLGGGQRSLHGLLKLLACLPH